MTRDNNGQASHENPMDVIKTPNKDTRVKIGNSNMRLCQESGESEKHTAWSHKDLEVGVHLKVLHVRISIPLDGMMKTQ